MTFLQISFGALWVQVGQGSSGCLKCIVACRKKTNHLRTIKLGFTLSPTSKSAYKAWTRLLTGLE